MNILGARSVTVISVASGAPLWSIGEPQTDEPVRMGEPPDTGPAVSAGPDTAKIVTAAGKLVALSDTAGEIDDILATSASWFHVFRMVPGGPDGDYIVHLVLDRSRANLAMARREFRDLVNADRGVRTDPVVPAAPAGPVSNTGRAVGRRRRARPTVDEPVQSPTALPQRVAGRSWSVQNIEVSFPAWFAPDDDELYAVDKLTLDRVMEGLRRLA